MQDPTLARVKLIAEPWDLGPAATSWQSSGRHGRVERQVSRRRAPILARDSGLRGALAARLQGSADLFDHHGRRRWESLNFITAHDGFTLQDWVSYQRKHNEANGEENRDGTDNNASNNWGVEGATDDAAIQATRERSSARFWPRCCSRTARRCCSAAMNLAAPSAATTTPTRRITRCPGSTRRRRCHRRESSSGLLFAADPAAARVLQLAQRLLPARAHRAAAAGTRHRVVRRKRRHHARRGLAVHRRAAAERAAGSPAGCGAGGSEPAVDQQHLRLTQLSAARSALSLATAPEYGRRAQHRSGDRARGDRRGAA